MGAVKGRLWHLGASSAATGYNLKAAGQALGVSGMTVFRWVKRGWLPDRRQSWGGRGVHVLLFADLEALLLAHPEVVVPTGVRDVVLRRVATWAWQLDPPVPLSAARRWLGEVEVPAEAVVHVARVACVRRSVLRQLTGAA